jgi:hypothetical protein
MTSSSARHRRGSLIIEAVISVALLATAGYALTRLARNAANLSQQADQRLVATLTAANTIERLRGLSAQQVSERASDVATDLSEVSGCEVQLATEPFTTPDHTGIHIRIVVSAPGNVRVTAHDWRLDAVQKSADQDPPAQSEEDDEA